MRNNPRKKEQMMISAAIVVCVVVIVAGYFIKSAKDREALQIGSITLGSGASAESSIVHYKGKAYQYNQNLMNVLFLGIDTTQDLSQEDPTVFWFCRWINKKRLRGFCRSPVIP